MASRSFSTTHANEGVSPWSAVPSDSKLSSISSLGPKPAPFHATASGYVAGYDAWYDAWYDAPATDESEHPTNGNKITQDDEAIRACKRFQGQGEATSEQSP